MSEVYGASGPAGTFDDTSLANLDDTEQKQLLGETIYPMIEAVQPLPVVGALLALENEVLQALLRNRQSLTAAMDAMRMHDVCDGIYDLLRAGLAMRRA